DDSIDTIPLAFLSTAFGDDDLPTVDFSNICSSSGGSNDCSDMATDIKACQAKGKTITLSIGGATSSVILSGDSQGKTFADTIWNSFLGGSSDTRPFGDAILDGVDLDLESGDGAGYAAFVTQLRTHTDSADKTYYVTGAPQCPYPDAYIGEVLSSVGFDAVYVQFYNNPSCGLTAASTSGWNFATWDKWAKSSPNPDVKVYIGAPASSSAAGSGYVDADTLAQIAQENRDKYSSFGGVMLWDVSEAYSQF
ncbi:glycoside hydrolase, partial [Stereum hirsutum FP-91666 SS1]|uniref:glycoside hydrolase n=1 Tax=Stereum hirsutum (strain FP-91666) TaxID=721885 RepID=UPI000440D93A